MFKGCLTDVFVCKGFEDNPALKFFGQDETCVQFRVGEKVYDANADNNVRWVNHSVKAFGAMCERIKKMQLKEGSHVNIVGEIVLDTWLDSKTNEKKSAYYLKITDIEYISGGSKKSENGDKNQEKKKNDSQQGSEGVGKSPEDSTNFEGYKPFCNEDFFDKD